MNPRMKMAALLALALAPAVAAAAQVPELARLTGTRLDVTASGEVSRIPDIVRIEAGVNTEAPNAAEAMRQNQARMERVRAALTRAGIADRDTQTSSFQLEAVYRSGAYSRRNWSPTAPATSCSSACATLRTPDASWMPWLPRASTT